MSRYESKDERPRDLAEWQQWNELCLDLLEGEEPSDRNIDQLFASGAFCRLMAAHSLDHVELLATAGLDDQRESQLRGSHDESPASLVELESSVRSSGDSDRRFARSVGSWWMAAAAAVLVGVTLIGVHQLTGGGDAESIAQQKSLAEIVEWSQQVSVDGQPVAKNDLPHRVQAGQFVVAQGVGSYAILRYDDGTEVTVASDSAVSLDSLEGQKRISVASGFLSASVAPQPAGKPLLILTGEATVEVIGTELAISRSSDSTTLSVTEGRVKMTRSYDGRSILVDSGQFAVAAKNGDYAPQSMVTGGDTWAVDFEDGLPLGWRSGEWVTGNLPDDSAGGVRAVQAAVGSDFAVATNMNDNVWRDGLFKVREDSVLNLRFKIETGDFSHILIFGRGERHYEYQETPEVREALKGHWRTLSVPLSDFKRANIPHSDSFQRREAGAPEPGLPIYLVMISSQQRDAGIVVDEIWVSRGGDVVDET